MHYKQFSTEGNDTMKRLTLVGGDRRMLSAAAELCKDHEVRLTGFELTDPTERISDLCCSENLPERLESFPEGLFPLELEEAMSGSDCVILPLPAFSGELISAPFSSREIETAELLKLMAREGTRLLCGGMLDRLKGAAQLPEQIFDYYRDEAFALYNSIPTAEGAIMTAMEELGITLYGARVLIVGGGRIGKALGLRLNALGADVTLTSRSSRGIAEIFSLGLKAADTALLSSLAADRDVIFNTVPQILFTRKVLEALSPGTLLIDLASKPGGIDIGAAGELGIKVRWALSLPGIYSPITAGRTIASVIREYLSKCL